MDLTQWIEQIQFCQEQPEVLDFDAIEAALDHLDELVELNLTEFKEPNEEVDEPARQTLLTMTSVLSNFCDHLAAFLEDLDFGRLTPAWREAQALGELSHQLCSRSQLLGHGVF